MRFLKPSFHIIVVSVTEVFVERSERLYGNTILIVSETILTSEADRWSRSKHVSSSRCDSVTKNSVTKTIFTLETIIWKPGLI